MANQFGELASGIVEYEFDYITGSDAATQVTKCSGWLETNLGQLNTLIYSSFFSGDIGQEESTDWKNPLKQEEKSIFTQLYLQDYYNRESRIILRNFTLNNTAGTSSTSTSDYTMTPWTTLKEGDTVIQREAIKITASARTQAAKVFKGYADAAEEKLKDLVYSYNYYQGHPRQVAGSDGD